MWNVMLQPKVVTSLKHLSKDAAKTVFLYFNDYLPKDLKCDTLTTANIKMLKGVYLFPKESSQGIIHIFAHIDFEKKLIKIMHLYLHHPLPRKKRGQRNS